MASQYPRCPCCVRNKKEVSNNEPLYVVVKRKQFIYLCVRCAKEEKATLGPKLVYGRPTFTASTHAQAVALSRKGG